MVQIAAAALGDAAQVVGSVEVPLLVVEHQIVVDVGHRETVAHALQQVVGFAGQVDRLRQLRLLRDYNDRQLALGGTRLAKLGRGFERQRVGAPRAVGRRAILRHRRATGQQQADDAHQPSQGSR